MAEVDLAARLRARIARHGPLPWSAYMEAALYDPSEGFYARGGGAGRRGDFLTSPEVGPLFGAVVARALDGWWQGSGRPAPFVVVDAGAGPGTLARSVLAAAPACAGALRYVMVEVSPAQRQRHGDHLPLERPEAAGLGPSLDPDEPAAAVARGPIAVSLPELPAVPAHVIVANELLDNLPVDVLARRWDGWFEMRVGLDADRFVEVPVPTSPERRRWADAAAPGAGEGARIPVAVGATAWLGDALARLAPGGRLLVIDYTATTAEHAARPPALPRSYRIHHRTNPLADPGTNDITVDVPLDQLTAVRPPALVQSQAVWLRVHGLDELVAEGRRRWTERAAVGDLEAVRARSRVAEAEALTDPTGLGAFTVAEWVG